MWQACRSYCLVAQQLLALPQMKPRWLSLAVEMQMALFPRSFPTAARRTTTFSQASMHTVLWTAFRRKPALAGIVGFASLVQHDMVLTTASSPACSVLGAAKAAWTVLGRRLRRHRHVPECPFLQQRLAGEQLLAWSECNFAGPAPDSLWQLHKHQAFVAGKAHAISGVWESTSMPIMPTCTGPQAIMQTQPEQTRVKTASRRTPLSSCQGCRPCLQLICFEWDWDYRALV